MSHIIDDEYSEIILYVTELRRKFYRKLENQMFVIEQQRDRIDYQQRQIDDQRVIIDELAWQIRDLRDSVRQCTEKLYEHGGCSNCSTIRKDGNRTMSPDKAKFNRQNHLEKDGKFLGPQIMFLTIEIPSTVDIHFDLGQLAYAVCAAEKN